MELIDWKYRYSAELVHVVDGDTVDLSVDLGMYVSIRDRFRLYGINAWEIRGEDKAKGLRAKLWLAQRLSTVQSLEVLTFKDKKGKYGRWLAILMADGENINEQMVQEGHAIKQEY